MYTVYYGKPNVAKFNHKKNEHSIIFFSIKNDIQLKKSTFNYRIYTFSKGSSTFNKGI